METLNSANVLSFWYDMVYKNEGRFDRYIHYYECIKRTVEAGHARFTKFGRFRAITDDMEEKFSASVSIIAPNMAVSQLLAEVELARAAQALDRVEKRKRYNLVFTNEGVYILGGYIFDQKKMKRKISLKDYVYKNGRLIPIPALPGAGVMCGVGTDGTFIYVIGGVTPYNTTSQQFLALDTRTNKWLQKPDYPIPVAAPGVMCWGKAVAAVGGYGLVVGQLETYGSFNVFGDGAWIRRAQLSARGRPVLMLSGGELYAVSGFTVDEKGSVHVLDDISKYNYERNLWEPVSTIPEMSKEFAIGYGDDQILVIFKRTDPKNPTVFESKVLRYYDLVENRWHEGQPRSQSPKKEDIKSTTSKKRNVVR